MSDTEQRRHAAADVPYSSAREPEATGWVGYVVFAGVMLMLLGGLQILEGFVALVRDEYYLVAPNGLLLSFDFTAWGWIHLIIGLIAVAAGIGILAGQTWARVTGIVIAALSVAANLVFLPAYPFWALIAITLDVLAIYALAVHGREVRY